MPVDEGVVAIVSGWVGKAENDLKNAAHAIKLGADCPTDTVGFHAEQCAEKYLKAVLAFRAIAFPRIHDIEELVRLLPQGLLADWPVAEQRRLTTYAVMTRYPGDYEPLSLSEARLAVRIARRVRRELRTQLPKAALRHPKAKRRRRKR